MTLESRSYGKLYHAFIPSYAHHLEPDAAPLCGHKPSGPCECQTCVEGQDAGDVPEYRQCFRRQWGQGLSEAIAPAAGHDQSELS